MQEQSEQIRVISHRHKKSAGIAAFRKQHGAALIFIMFIVGLAVAAFIMKTFDAESLKARQEEKTMQALGQAKEALIAWSVSHADVPGMTPYPDRSSDGNYDGYSDCPPAMNPFAYSYLIGQLPIYRQTNPCISPQTGIGGDWTDSQGNRLWYAVSRNLVREYQSPGRNPVINPGIINIDSLKPVPYDGTNATSSYPWLVVRDINGNVVSDRVAAVIVSPGPPLSGQSRTNTASSSHFLDQITIGTTTYSNRDYDQPDEDFVMGSDAVVNNTFNDRLVYITIDELIAALERRVAAEARDALLSYQNATGRYPYAAPLGSTENYSCIDATVNGLLPLDSNPSNNCSCTSGRDCSCDFDIIDSVAFNRGGPNWDSASGSCSAAGSVCTCAGAGDCSLLGIIRFECDVAGNCNSNLISGTFSFSGAFENSNVNTRTGACSHSCGSTTVTCDGNGTFSSGSCGDPGIAPTIAVNTVTGSNQLTTSSNFIAEQIVAGMRVFGDGIQDGTVVSSVTNAATLMISRNATATGQSNITFSRLSEWFINNGWQDYIYYSVARDAVPTMTLGGRTGVEAIIATVGARIDTAPFAQAKGAAQNRISCNIEDYLDSSENVSANQTYEATNKQRALNYNDQLLIVAP